MKICLGLISMAVCISQSYASQFETVPLDESLFPDGRVPAITVIIGRKAEGLINKEPEYKGTPRYGYSASMRGILGAVAVTDRKSGNLSIIIDINANKDLTDDPTLYLDPDAEKSAPQEFKTPHGGKIDITIAKMSRIAGGMDGYLIRRSDMLKGKVNVAGKELLACILDIGLDGFGSDSSTDILAYDVDGDGKIGNENSRGIGGLKQLSKVVNLGSGLYSYDLNSENNEVTLTEYEGPASSVGIDIETVGGVETTLERIRLKSDRIADYVGALDTDTVDIPAGKYAYLNMDGVFRKGGKDIGRFSISSMGEVSLEDGKAFIARLRGDTALEPIVSQRGRKLIVSNKIKNSGLRISRWTIGNKRTKPQVAVSLTRDDGERILCEGPQEYG